MFAEFYGLGQYAVIAVVFLLVVFAELIVKVIGFFIILFGGFLCLTVILAPLGAFIVVAGGAIMFLPLGADLWFVYDCSRPSWLS